MKFKNIGTAIANFGKNTAFFAKKKSPELCLIGALVCGAGALVSTWVAARKMDKVLEEPNKIIETAKSMELSETYTEKEQKHDILLGKVKRVGAIAKLLAPAFVFTGGAVACTVGGFKTLKKANLRLVAANGVLAKELSDCQKKLESVVGKAEAYKLKYADKLEEKGETVKGEDGEEKTEKTKKPKKGYEQECFGRFFDEACSDWSKDPQHNIYQLRIILQDLNSRLRANRILLLNDVYEALGLEKTQAGYSHGWAYYPGKDEPFVSFGEWLFNDEELHRIITMNERVYWLDFNCSPINFDEIPFRKV